MSDTGTERLSGGPDRADQNLVTTGTNVMETFTPRLLIMDTVEYDALRHRIWILGQRCHHGATGALLAAGGLVAAAIGALRPGSGAALAGAGTLLMAHDWKDRAVWFERGHGSQP